MCQQSALFLNCFGSVSHLGTCRHSRRKVSDEQDTGTRLDELGADSEESCGGSTGRGHDSAEEISRRGELYVHKNGQLWGCGHGWMWMGKVGLWLKASSGAEKVFERSSVEALGAGDCWDCEQHKNVPYKSSWDQSPLHPPNCSTQGLAHGGLAQVQGWETNNPNLPLPRTDFKIVPKTTERTLKFSFALSRCNEMGFI